MSALAATPDQTPASPVNTPANATSTSTAAADAAAELERFYAACKATGLLEKTTGYPRLHPPTVERSGMRIGYMVDLDGTLVRLVQNG